MDKSTDGTCAALPFGFLKEELALASPGQTTDLRGASLKATLGEVQAQRLAILDGFGAKATYMSSWVVAGPGEGPPVPVGARR